MFVGSVGQACWSFHAPAVDEAQNISRRSARVQLELTWSISIMVGDGQYLIAPLDAVGQSMAIRTMRTITCDKITLGLISIHFSNSLHPSI